jgi:carbon storage regulator
MLILSRKVGQSIVVGGNVIVKVVRVDGDQIKLGIQAPEEISVHRQEIQAEIDAGNVKPPSGVASALKSILGIQE